MIQELVSVPAVSVIKTHTPAEINKRIICKLLLHYIINTVICVLINKHMRCVFQSERVFMYTCAARDPPVFTASRFTVNAQHELHLRLL